ncbi:MAG: hypothetical protein AB8B84_02670 [Granulosicoccus sp.]
MTPRHDLLKHTYQAASRAVENGEEVPLFQDPWLPKPVTDSVNSDESGADADGSEPSQNAS